MKKITLLSAVVFALSCGGEAPPAQVKQGLLDMEGYREWPLRRNVAINPFGHGKSHVYANDVVTNYLAKVAPEGVTPPTLRYPTGSILVSDVLLADGTLQYVAVMRKPEQAPAGASFQGGWIWSRRKTPKAVDEYQGEGDCLTCHTQANKQTFKDSVFVFPECGDRCE